MGNELKTIRVIAKEVAKSATHEAFTSYYIVTDGGRLVDLRFCRTVDTRLFEGMKKFEVNAEVEDASARYEYPRYYCKAIDPATLVKIA